MTRYKRCVSCDRLVTPVNNIKSKKILCAFCKKHNKQEIVQMPIEETELFEDDPRALKEQDYGRVTRNATHVFSRNILDDIG